MGVRAYADEEMKVTTIIGSYSLFPQPFETSGVFVKLITAQVFMRELTTGDTNCAPLAVSAWPSKGDSASDLGSFNGFRV